MLTHWWGTWSAECCGCSRSTQWGAFGVLRGMVLQMLEALLSSKIVSRGSYLWLPSIKIIGRRNLLAMTRMGLADLSSLILIPVSVLLWDSRPENMGVTLVCMLLPQHAQKHQHLGHGVDICSTLRMLLIALPKWGHQFPLSLILISTYFSEPLVFSIFKILTILECV